MANLLRSKADLAQKKRMITTRRVAFATTDNKLYPARSKRNHTVVAPASARTAAFLLLHRSTSATWKSFQQIEQSTTINIEKKQHSQAAAERGKIGRKPGPPPRARCTDRGIWAGSDGEASDRSGSWAEAPSISGIAAIAF